MNVRGRMAVKAVLLLIGTALLIAGGTGVLDEYWSGMGGGLLIVGVVQLIRLQRYKNDNQYRESVDVETSDERNKFLSMKAWSWAGYLFVMIAAVGSIVLKMVGREELMMMAAGSVCLMTVLYWISWLILRKKY